jgi:hypothetical protein
VRRSVYGFYALLSALSVLPPPIQTGLHVCVAGFDLQEYVTKENHPLEFKFVLALVVQ